MKCATVCRLGERTVLELPPEVLDRLGLRAGDRVELHEEGGRVVLRRCDPECAEEARPTLHDALEEYEEMKRLLGKDGRAEDARWLSDRPVGKELL